MPRNKIVSSGRAKAAIAAVLAISTSIGGIFYANPPGKEPIPAAVELAVNKLIIPWEGLVLKSHWDRYARIWDICYGETKGIGPGMTKTKAECQAMLMERVVNDYYRPLTKCIAGFEKKPLGLQATLISGAYNFGVGAACRSTAAKQARAGNYHSACLAQTAFNKAGGRVVEGLVRRREMGDAQRIGEAELCVSGL
ncbi:MAG: glycoside hydrolase [Mesorhizobium sp.]|uniref:lysozyme n=1 Tax=Mesorhizobium sp. TaxID=1871066 RepID=UPI000FEA87B6|nr:lysozyme [Mesorhizobium sp.]RWM27906.1 MAG: glycoside hydrolase [Mesorhizobium sp.]